MKKFKFTTKDGKESIGICEASTEREATEIFARTKKLKVEDFLSIYKVLESVK
jgi:hypothetical protein